MWTGSIIYHIKIGNNLSGQQQDLIGFSVAFGNLAMEQYLQCEKMLRIDEVEKSMLKKYVQFDSNCKNILREKRTRKEYSMLTGYVNKNMCDFFSIKKFCNLIFLVRKINIISF